MKRNAFFLVSALLLGWLTAAGFPPASTVNGRVNLLRADRTPRTDTNASMAVWLTPLSAQAAGTPTSRSLKTPQIIQRNKRFETRVLVVEVGTLVGFPNKDPFFHNVFSFFEGRRFDLGLYEANSTKSVRFDRPGVSYIFCNIHPQMNATVVAVDTPYFVLLSAPGNFQIAQVPPGRYQLAVWAERVSLDQLKSVSRQVTIEGDNTALGAIHLREDVAAVRANKYGKAYDTPVFSSPIYAQP